MTFKELREKRGYPVGSKLARDAGIHQTTVSHLDNDKHPDPRSSNLKAIAETLGVSMETVYRAIQRTAKAA